jgi:hypothetical protein
MECQPSRPRLSVADDAPVLAAMVSELLREASVDRVLQKSHDLDRMRQIVTEFTNRQTGET